MSPPCNHEPRYGRHRWRRARGPEPARAGSDLAQPHEVEFYFGLALAHFGADKHNKALFWLNKVLNDTEQTLRQDIFTYARLFNLVVHYELANYDLLEYIVRSTQRFLSKRHRAHQVENLLVVPD